MPILLGQIPRSSRAVRTVISAHLAWVRLHEHVLMGQAHEHMLMGQAHEHLLMWLAHEHNIMLMGLAHEHMPMGLAHQHVPMGLAHEKGSWRLLKPNDLKSRSGQHVRTSEFDQAKSPFFKIVEN